ncbi:unnamed protein product [Absidia cylindrospora]
MSSPFSDSSSTCSTSSSAFSFDDDTEAKRNNHSTTTTTAASPSVLSKLAGTVRDTRTKVEQKKSELNASMQERLPEWRSRGVMYGNRARETSLEWSRKGKEAVDQWKKDRQDKTSENAVLLTKLCEDDPIPAVLRRCINYLDEFGIHEVGIYRIPGSTTTVNKLRSTFNFGDDCDMFATRPDPNAAATLLKMYLRELPEPLIPYEISQDYKQQINRHIQQEQQETPSAPTLLPNETFDMPTTEKLPTITSTLLDTIHIITSKLPAINLYLLEVLCQHLKRIASYADQNKMSTSNLALIFIPTLGMGRLLFHCMVDHHSQVFGSPGNKTSSSLPVLSTTESTSVSTLPLISSSPSMLSAGPIRTHIRSISASNSATFNKPLPPPLPHKPKHINIPKPPRRQNKSLDLGRHHHQQQGRGEHSKTLSDTDVISMTTPPAPPPKPPRSPIAKPATEYFKSNIHRIAETKPRSKSVSSPNTSPSSSHLQSSTMVSSLPTKTTAMNSPSSTSSSSSTVSLSSKNSTIRCRSGSRVGAIGRQFEQLMANSPPQSSSPSSSLSSLSKNHDSS